MPKKAKEVIEEPKLNKQGLVPGAIVSNEDFMKVMNKQRAKEKAKKAE
jgi:hypothetical protein